MKASKKVLFALLGVLMTVGAVLSAASTWLQDVFQITFQQLLYTLSSPIKGTDPNLVRAALINCLPYVAIVLALYILLLYLAEAAPKRLNLRIWVRVGKKEHGFGVAGPLRVLAALMSLFVFVNGFVYTDRVLKIREYLEKRAHPTTIFEDEYIDPAEVQITAAGKPKNLIHLYLESMEVTYADTASGGVQPVNYIPELTRLAQQNLSFSNNDRMGGWASGTGETWTMAALFATTSGLPFAFPVGENSMDKREQFASGVVSLGEILAQKGYVNEFLCGSDGAFAGRKRYFEQHGAYRVYDLFSARADGYIPEDYFVWWGMEDAKLFPIARDELTRLAAAGEPFNFTMLTVDTHHVGGYVCSECGNEYAEQVANVIRCQDRQVAEFVAWCQAQPFYEDTVIVITGDHPRMDTMLVETQAYRERKVYNCFLNCDLAQGARTTNRIFRAEDMFPTILNAMGFTIEGDRLGMGTSLFSDKPTMSERLGDDFINNEYNKYSTYYIDRFS